MAAPTTSGSSTAASSQLGRLKPKKPLDKWSTREKLCLASAVFKIGDQNWVSVSRAIKPFLEPNRPPEWFHQKNCVLQYYDLMEQQEQPKRKRGGDKSESDAPSLQIMRKMTIERSEQLKTEIMEMQQNFKQLKSEIELIKAGQWDDKLQDIWDEIQKEQKVSDEQQIKVEVKTEDPEDEDIKVSAADSSSVTALPAEVDDNTQDSLGENIDISVVTDEEGNQTPASFATSTPIPSVSSSDGANKMPAASQLLSSLLKSNVKTATGLQQLKIEHEQEQVQQQQTGTIGQTDSTRSQATPQDNTVGSSSSDAKGGQPSLTANESGTSLASASSNEPSIVDVVEETAQDNSTSLLPDTITFDESASLAVTEEESSYLPVEGIEEEVVEQEVVIKEEREETVVEADVTEKAAAEIIEVDTGKEGEAEEVPVKQEEGPKTDVELPDTVVKDEPLSPSSSVSSRVSEAGGKRGNRRGRPRGSRSFRVSMRKSTTDEDKKDDGGSSRFSDVELSEDEVRDSEDLELSHIPSAAPSSILSESFPNSPASLSMCSDTEEEKSFKQWKKSIMLVWRAAATHKYANVFLHPVTNEIAPGYHSVVLRPMDLSTIKKNVEIGVIRSTVEFQRDMMLMFTNAIMYNNSDHNVFKMAKEMYDDVMQHIEIMIQTTTDTKNLRQSRRPDLPEKDDDLKKRRASVDLGEGGKTKKRKTRLDESQT